MQIYHLILTAAVMTSPALMDSNCTNHEFLCGDLQCIALTRRCDGTTDCVDSSDEMDCDTFHCEPPNYYRCNNSHCISASFMCDQEDDCGDLSDEIKCEDFKTLLQRAEKCDENHWQCSDKLCIHSEWVCDGKVDCLDGSDEILGCSTNITCDGFKCRNGHCIPAEWKCDGQDDCGDESDEINCEVKFENCTLTTDQFLCKQGNNCIPFINVCDGVKNCPDMSDEGPACNVTCEEKACPYNCVSLPTGPKCICPPGYSNTDDQHCEDINECESYGICDQGCRNLPGSHECFCQKDYQLQSDNRTCKSLFGEAVLFFSSKKDIRAYLLKSDLYFPVVRNLKQAIGIDFDGRYVYWTEIFAEHESILRSLRNGTKKELLITSGLGAPEDLHIDWWTGNIYFTDAERQHIGVCTEDGRRCSVLVNEGIHKPRGIVLNPEDGEMYWSDWGQRPEIGRAFMDGTNDTSFISTAIYWPNGLTIDHPNNRLYWTDAKIMTLESINLQGTDRRIILQGVVKHPYAISVFENRLYWSDWSTHSIQSCEKFTGKDHQTIIKETKDFVYDITIYHPNLRTKPHINPCAASFCSDICLLRGRSQYTCSCPENRVLGLDRHTCKDREEKQKIILGAGHLLVHIGHQLLGRHEITALPIYVERIGALAYGSEENTLFISDLGIHSIVGLNLQSGNSEVVVGNDLEEVVALDYDYLGRNLYWCDSAKRTVEVMNLKTKVKTVLVHDNSEVPESIALVPEKGIMFVAFQKSNKRGSHVDRYLMDGSDRVYSIEHGILGPISLLYDRDLQRIFVADAGTGNIESTSVEGDDRHGFRSLLTSPVSLTSLNREIFWVNKNSGRMYWADKYNTADNDYNKKITLDLQEIPEKMHLVSITSQPTGLSPCDYKNCSHLCLLSEKAISCACPIGMSLAANNRTCNSPFNCQTKEIYCHHSEICLPQTSYCKECPHGEDEKICQQRCSLDQYQCDSGECVQHSRKCDTRFDCRDGSDEHNCTRAQSTLSCPQKHFRCESDSRCITELAVCNGIYDCTNREDEKNCVTAVCNDLEFRCLSGACMPKEWECDGDYDCEDMSDEHENCTLCTPDMFTCSNAKCISKKFVCNQDDDCGDNSDEHYCVFHSENVCSLHEFSCSLSNLCIAHTARCNGIPECPHHEDEQNCSTCHTQDEFQCTNQRCIPNQWICDNVNDCGDNSDETTSLCDIANNCDAFLCTNGQCLDYSLVCNGKNDCGDGSDEEGLCESACLNNSCNQVCVKSPRGPLCKCYPGYHIQNDSSCQDLNECNEGRVCSQICHNTPGSYLCDCYHGFVLKEDEVTCKSKQAMSLIYTFDNQVRESTQASLKLIYSNIEAKITGLAVDTTTSDIYVTVDESPAIFRIDQSRRDHVQTAGQPGLISLDLNTRNVYYVNNDKAIGVCHFDSSVCLRLIQTDRHISAISVDGVNRCLFYSLVSWWMFHTPTFVIYKANLDGSGREEVVKSRRGFVSGLSYDVHRREVYYVDRHNGQVGRVGYDDAETTSVVLVSNLKRPSGVEFFEDSLYVLTQGGMQKCQIIGTLLCHSFDLNTHSDSMFVIVPESRRQQPVLNSGPCFGHNCTNICLPKDESHYHCLCEGGKLVELSEECEDQKHEITTENDPTIKNIHTNQQFHPVDDDKGSIIAGTTIVICLLVSATIAYYVLKKRAKSTLKISMKFSNPGYGLDFDESHKSIVHPGQHEYSNPVEFYPNEDPREAVLVDV